MPPLGNGLTWRGINSVLSELFISSYFSSIRKKYIINKDLSISEISTSYLTWTRVIIGEVWD